jgi:hypothetical protein
MRPVCAMEPGLRKHTIPVEEPRSLQITSERESRATAKDNNPADARGGVGKQFMAMRSTPRYSGRSGRVTFGVITSESRGVNVRMIPGSSASTLLTNPTCALAASFAPLISARPGSAHLYCCEKERRPGQMQRSSPAPYALSLATAKYKRVPLSMLV